MLSSVSPSDSSAPATAVNSAEHAALMQAVARVVLPLARLAVARGIPFAEVDAQMKQAFVKAAREAHPHLTPHRAVSRIATTTGLNRREVTRLTQEAPSVPKRRTVVGEVFAHWANDASYQDQQGRPRVLPRQGATLSFESLAHSVTRDVHPRSLLGELLRLGLAAHHIESDTVALLQEAFVPRGDAERMLNFLGDNVGDHLSAAVANVLGDGREHFEQAIFADELSAESLERLRSLVSAQWRDASAALVPAIESLIAQDRAAGRLQDRRLCIGFYNFTDSMDGTATPVGVPSTSASADTAERS